MGTTCIILSVLSSAESKLQNRKVRPWQKAIPKTFSTLERICVSKSNLALQKPEPHRTTLRACTLSHTKSDAIRNGETARDPTVRRLFSSAEIRLAVVVHGGRKVSSSARGRLAELVELDEGHILAADHPTERGVEVLVVRQVVLEDASVHGDCRRDDRVRPSAVLEDGRDCHCQQLCAAVCDEPAHVLHLQLIETLRNCTACSLGSLLRRCMARKKLHCTLSISLRLKD